jgi:hypothetical protein
MRLHIDKTLQECVENAHEEARLGRDGRTLDRKAIFAEALGELEYNGDAMRYLDRKGRIAGSNASATGRYQRPSTYDQKLR